MCDQQRLRPACAYAQSDQSHCLSLEYSITLRLLTEHHWEFLCLLGGCTGWSESTPVKMPHCWKSHVAAHLGFGICVYQPCTGHSLPTTPNLFVFESRCLVFAFATIQLFLKRWHTDKCNNASNCDIGHVGGLVASMVLVSKL